MKIQYLGQEGMAFRGGGQTLVIDPYLSYSVDRLPGFPPGFWKRNYPPPFLPAELGDVDLVLCTHDHLDHADPESLLGIARASPQSRFGGPRVTVELMRKIGIPAERTRVLNAGEVLRWNSVSIEPVAAAHEDYQLDEDGFHRFLGFLLRWDGKTIYHAGDTLATPELSARLQREPIDLGFLPVNGADDERRKLGIVGNMNVREAAALAVKHQFDWVVPMHYDLYQNNGLSPEEFADAWFRQPGVSNLQLKNFQPGESMDWPP